MIGGHGMRGAGVAASVAGRAVADSSGRRSSSGPTDSATATPTAAMIPSETGSGTSALLNPALARAATIPARLQKPWNEASRLRPYRRCTPTPCMFMLASTAPRNSPNAPTARYRPCRVGTSPTSVIITPTSGPLTRSTSALPSRGARNPASTLPSPATTGTASRTRVRSSSVKLNLSLSEGTWVSRPAKQSPWTK